MGAASGLAVAPCGAPVMASALKAGIAGGSQAPRAAVETLGGKAMDLAQYVGKKPMVLEF